MRRAMLSDWMVMPVAAIVYTCLALLAQAVCSCGERPTVEDARLALDRIERLDRGIRAMCVPLPDAEPEHAGCVELIDAFNALHSGAP